MSKRNKRNIGIYNNNWAGGHRRDIIQTEPLTEDENRAVMIELAIHQRKVSLSWARYYRSKGMTKQREGSLRMALVWNTKLHELCPTPEMKKTDPRLARRENILAAFRDEPITKAEVHELYTELAEIDQSLQFNPSDTMQDYISASWNRIQEIPL